MNMSRSRKKNNIYKSAGDTGFKKLYNRSVRRNLKQELLSSDDPDTVQLPQGNQHKKLNCSWNIADYISRFSWEDCKKLYYNKETGMYQYYNGKLLTEDELWIEWIRLYGSKQWEIYFFWFESYFLYDSVECVIKINSYIII